MASLLDELCWCGETREHEDYCREHAPRCRSGAHWRGQCGCVGDAMLTGVRAAHATEQAIALWLENRAAQCGRNFQGAAARTELLAAAALIRNQEWKK